MDDQTRTEFIILVTIFCGGGALFSMMIGEAIKAGILCVIAIIIVIAIFATKYKSFGKKV